MPPALTQALAQPPQGFGQAVNPPEQTLPPAPPAPPEVTTPPEAAKKRGRKPKAEASAPEESAAVVAVGLGFAEELAIAATKGLFSNPSFNPAQVDAAAAAVKRYVGALIA
jgi:hypothetical protein